MPIPALSPLMLYGAWILAASVLTLFMYWLDKSKAQRGSWRVPERTLHLLSLIGGFPGGWIGCLVLRHKSQKPVFLVVLITATLLHGALVLLLLT